jgi:hypothetical protein
MGLWTASLESIVIFSRTTHLEAAEPMVEL